MLGKSVSTNSSQSKQTEMNYGQCIVDQIIQDFEESVHTDGFTKLVYTFMKMYYCLSNPKLADLQKMLETFQQQHYHEFLFVYKDRNKKCVEFIEILKEFGDNKKPKKKDYQTMFGKLLAFKDILGTLPGGSCNDIPFIFTSKAIEKWFYDQVAELRKSLGITAKKEAGPFYSILKDDNQWSGHTRCAANNIQLSIPLSVKSAKYLLQVGYETVETLKRKWAIEIEDAAVNGWALFQPKVEDIEPVLKEIKQVATQALKSTVKMFYSNASVEKCRLSTRQHILSQYESSFNTLRNDHSHLKRKFDELSDSSNECEMMLSLQRRKTKDAYEDNEYLRKRLDNLQTSLIQTERANDRLKASYHQQQLELQQSIQREWNYYNQQQQQRFR